jgi:hypothetical protein
MKQRRRSWLPESDQAEIYKGEGISRIKPETQKIVFQFSSSGKGKEHIVSLKTIDIRWLT